VNHGKYAEKDKMKKYCSAFVLQMLCLYKHNTGTIIIYIIKS